MSPSGLVGSVVVSWLVFDHVYGLWSSSVIVSVGRVSPTLDITKTAGI
jgi:hypothetical protein